jgi:hypothetical protein
MITITSPENNIIYSSEQTLVYSVSDNLDSNPAIFGPVTNTVYQNLGTYILYITATDQAGNSSVQVLLFVIKAPPGSQSQLSGTGAPGNNPMNNSGNGGDFQFSGFNPAGAGLLYHPLTPVDTAAFESMMNDPGFIAFLEELRRPKIPR